MPIPYVVEQTPNGREQHDIYSRLLQDRIIMLNSGFDDQLASSIVAQLLFLEHNNKGAPIHMYINSPGGQVTAALAIYDTMTFISSPVYTYALGQAASAGSLIAQSGEAGHRYVFPNSTVMIHRVSSGTSGTQGSIHVQDLQLEDTIRSFEEGKRLNKRLTEIYVSHNSKGKTYEEIFETMKFDTYLPAQEAIDFGVADEILTKA